MIRVFPRRTAWTPSDPLAFVGDPPLFQPQRDAPVKVSVTFTWDIHEGERLYRAWSDYYADVEIGGPAFGDPGGEFEPNLFCKEGVVITSRGCPNKCGFCMVPRREGIIRELQIKDGWIVQDNNLLACSKGHIEGVFAMLRRQKKGAVFSGGIDSSLFTSWHRELIDSIKLSEIWFACDHNNDVKPLESVSKLLDGISPNKLRCYVLIGKEETISQATERLMAVLKLGFLPFAQLYQPQSQITYSKQWRDLARQWSRPAIYKSFLKK